MFHSWPLSYEFSGVFLLLLTSLTFCPSFQSTSPPPSLFSSHLAQNPFICDCNLKWLADYLRSNPIETSGARCASPRRLANKRIGQIKSKKFRCSGRPVAQCHCLLMSPSYFSLGPFISQTGFVVSVPLVSRCSTLLFSLSLRWEWLLSLHCLYLCLIPHLMSDDSWHKVLFGLSFAVPVLLNQYLPS